MINSTSRPPIRGRAQIGRNANPQNLGMLQTLGLQVEFGDRFAYGYCEVQQGKSNEGEQNGQENLEEGKEAGSDEATDHRRPLIT